MLAATAASHCNSNTQETKGIDDTTKKNSLELEAAARSIAQQTTSPDVVVGK